MTGDLAAPGQGSGGAQSQRVDKWLWHARFARTRTAAQKMANSGHVRINRQRVTAPSRTVKPGDVLTLAIGRTVRVVAVTAIAPRRGSADAARLLYEDRTPVLTPAAMASRQADKDSAVRHEGRPHSRDRKRILALKRKQF